MIGKPDEMAGELALAFVVKGDQSLTESEIMKFVDEKSSPAKRLHGGIIFIDAIPKSPSGKILRLPKIIFSVHIELYTIHGHLIAENTKLIT